jgi:FKBP-type peptidyl-prolyl cis-trans isomerase SlyD
MQIAQHKHVTMAYNLRNDQGTMLESTEDRHPFAYVHGTSAILPTLEQALTGSSPGDEIKIQVPSEQAYGERDESLVFAISKTKFNEGDTVTPGTRVRVRTPSGIQILVITEVDDDRVTLDGNHPLAGMNLNFEVSVVGVRDCTKEELDQAVASQEEES